MKQEKVEIAITATLNFHENPEMKQEKVEIAITATLNFQDCPEIEDRAAAAFQVWGESAGILAERPGWI